MNNKDNKPSVGKIANIVKSIVKTFSGTGWIPDWLTTAKVLIPAALFSILFTVMILYIFVMYPIFGVQDTLHNAKNSVVSWFDKLGNFITGNGFVDDETAFTNKLEKVYNDYENRGVCIDDTLITATLSYRYMISNDVDAEGDIDYSDDDTQNNTETDTELNYKDMRKKIKKLAEKQVYNNQLSNADILAYLRTGKSATDEERSKMNRSTSSSSSDGSSTNNTGDTSVSEKVSNIQDVFFIGDSILGTLNSTLQNSGVKNIFYQGAANANFFLGKVGSPSDSGVNKKGEKFDWDSKIASISNPSGIYLILGQNLIGGVNSYVDSGIPDIQELIDKLKSQFDGVPIYLNQIIPAVENSKNYPKYMTPTYEYAVTKIKELASKNNIPYVESLNGYINDSGFAKDEYTDDGLHPNSKGAELIVKNIVDKITSDSNSDDSSDTTYENNVDILNESVVEDNDVGSTLPIDNKVMRRTSIQTKVFDLPENLGKVHTWTGWFDWDWKYGPGDAIKALGGINRSLGGAVGENDLGFITYGQWYAAATTSTYGTTGDMLFVIQDDNSVFPVIIADEKSQSYVPHDHNPANKWGHNNGKCVIEFETGKKWNRSVGECSKVQPLFDHYIPRIINVGSIYDTPEYIDNVTQALADANLTSYNLIDVGSVAGTSSYSISSSNGSSKTCPGDLEYFRPTNEDIESMDYKSGFIYKYYKDIFKNYDGIELNYAVENLIREIYSYKDSITSIMDKSSSRSSGICSISGDFENWLQCDNKWRDVRLGTSSKTICSSGCMVTSIAMQIKKSGTQLLVDEFNPKVFVETLNNNGGFSGALFANNPSSWKSIAPNWEEVESNVPLTGNRQQKTETLKKLIDQGYYVILTVKPNQGHWVALDRVDGETVYMMDPASSSTKLWDERYSVENTNTYTTFKAIDSASTTLTSTGVCSAATGQYKYYNQANVGNTNDGVHYGSYVSKCRGVTLNSIGCSQMSLAIVASGLVSPDITPITTADAYCDVGINHAVNMSDVVKEQLMEKLGLKATLLFDGSSSRENNKQKLVDILNQGYPVIINVTNHFVAVIPGSSKPIKLMDPGSKEKTKEYTIDEFDKVTWHGETTWKIAYYFEKRS